MWERRGVRVKLLIQVDTMCHKIPGFIEKAVRAGCKRVFIGMESINPETLVSPDLQIEYGNTDSAFVWEMFDSIAYDAEKFAGMLQRGVERFEHEK